MTRRAARPVKPPRRALAAPLVLCALLPGPAPARLAAPPRTEQEAKAAFDARALRRLSDMVGAYSRLPALRQRTVYVSKITPLALPDALEPEEDAEEIQNPKPKTQNPDGPSLYDPVTLPRETRLLYARPNLLRVELREKDGERGGETVRQWVSDGKTFWATQPEKNWYTRRKAPRNLADFARIEDLNSGSLELLMLMGVNPFAEARRSADAARVEGTARVRGAETDVVALTLSTPYEETVTRFYVGRGDSLLHRLSVETRPLAQTPAGQFTDPLERLGGSVGGGAAVGALPPVRTRLTYTNVIEPPNFEPDAFAFAIPKGAFLYGSSDGPLPGETKDKKRRSNLAEVLNKLRRQ